MNLNLQSLENDCKNMEEFHGWNVSVFCSSVYEIRKYTAETIDSLFFLQPHTLYTCGAQGGYCNCGTSVKRGCGGHGGGRDCTTTGPARESRAE